MIKFCVITEWIMSQKLSLLEKAILGVVQGMTANGGECWVTDDQFAEAFEAHKITVNRAVAELVKKGILVKEVHRKGYAHSPRTLKIAVPISDTLTPISDTLTTYKPYANNLLAQGLQPISDTLTKSKIQSKDQSKVQERVGAVAPTTPSPLPEKPKKEKPKTTVFDLTLTDADKRSLAEVYDRAMALRNLSPDQLPDKKAFLRACCEECRDWSVSNGKRRASWIATLRNWIRRAVKEYRPPQVQFKSAGERINEGMRKNRELAEAIRQREAEQDGTLLTSTTGALEWKEK